MEASFYKDTLFQWLNWEEKSISAMFSAALKESKYSA